jgi:glycosyl transferase family 87
VWRTACGVLLACLPALSACATLFAAALAAVKPMSADYGESIVYSHALRVVHGQPLYQPIDTYPFTVANYTPVFYWVGAALYSLLGPGFGPGRVLSMIAALATALMVGIIASRRVGGPWVAAFAAALFLALAFPGGVPWLGLYRVDLLGVALSIGSVAVLSYRRSMRAAAVAGVLAGLALLTKQTLVAALLAGTLWIWLDRRHAHAGAFVAAALLTLGIPCVVLEVSTRAFLQNTVLSNLNPFDLSVEGSLLREFVVAQWLPLVLAVVYLGLRRPWQTSAERLVPLYWVAASVSVFALGKVGANHNYWIEFAAATAILAARGAASVLRTATPGLAAVGAAGLILVVGADFGGPEGILGVARLDRSGIESLRTPTPNDEFERLVGRVRDAPGDVLAEPMDVLVLAGRPVEFEPLTFSFLLASGYWQAAPIVNRICSGQIRMVVLGYPLDEAADIRFGQYPVWAPPILSALQDTMVLERGQATRFLYTPRAPIGATCRAGSARG